MSPVEVLGAMVFLVALFFLVAFGLVLGAWAAVQAGTWAFGGITITVNNKSPLFVIDRGEPR